MIMWSLSLYFRRVCPLSFPFSLQIVSSIGVNGTVNETGLSPKYQLANGCLRDSIGLTEQFLSRQFVT